MTNKTESKKPWYAKWWGVLIIIVVLLNIVFLINSKDTTQDSNNSTDTTVLNNTKTENNITIEGFSKFISKDWGFSILFPEKPKENTLDLKDLTIYNFQSHKLISEKEPIQYNIFYSDIKGGKILDDNSIKAYLDNYASGKASMNNGKLIDENDIIFQGFPAREYIFVDEMQDIEMVHKGVVFIIDGDAMELSVIYPSTLSVEVVEYENFKKSFRLEAIHESLTQKYWSNGTIKLKPPLSWKKTNSSQENRILTYANKAGHSIELYEAKFNNQNVSCYDLQQEVGSKNIDNKGYIYRIFPNPDYDLNMKMIIKCIEKSNQSFILSGKAPENTFFRSQLIFEETLDSFSFE